VIERARGILMERDDLAEREAFECAVKPVTRTTRSSRSQRPSWEAAGSLHVEERYRDLIG
jgi:hypothetical protein